MWSICYFIVQFIFLSYPCWLFQALLPPAALGAPRRCGEVPGKLFPCSPDTPHMGYYHPHPEGTLLISLGLGTSWAETGQFPKNQFSGNCEWLLLCRQADLGPTTEVGKSEDCATEQTLEPVTWSFRPRPSPNAPADRSVVIGQKTWHL